MKELPLLPSVITDIVGSQLIIIFSFLSFRYTYLLSRREQKNFLWGFLHYFCFALVVFSISRATGHMVKQALLISDQGDIWRVLSPYSGGINTLLMISLSAVTIFYHKAVEGYRAIEEKADSLKSANANLEEAGNVLKQMNLHLEEIVDERTHDLAQSEKKFRNFFHNSKDMVFFCDYRGTIVDINDAGLSMLDYAEIEEGALTLGRLFEDVEVLKDFNEKLHNQRYVEDFEAEFIKQDGSIIYVLLSASAIYDKEQTYIGCEGIAKDLTRLKAMTAQMISSEKMASVGNMAAGIAHEINTPLGIILGYSQLMKEDFEPESEEYENLEVMERQSKTCRKIVADLLKYSRQTGTPHGEIDINVLLDDVLSITMHSLHLDHIMVKKEFEETLPHVSGDEEKLRQVFVNLINNAQHAMEDEGGTLIVKTRFDAEEQKIIASIIDHGTGISQADKNKIFDPFFTTKAVGKGTGLGLSVSYGIIEDHKGTILVESPLKGREDMDYPGTAMHIQLPVLKGGDNQENDNG